MTTTIEISAESNVPETVSSREFLQGVGERLQGRGRGAPESPPADICAFADVVKHHAPIAAADAVRLAGIRPSAIHNVLVTAAFWFPPIYQEDAPGPGGRVMLAWNDDLQCVSPLPSDVTI